MTNSLINNDLYNGNTFIREATEAEIEFWAEIQELNLIKARYMPDCESDSLFASCTCLTKSPDYKRHKAGCKYRLISERDEAREQVSLQSTSILEHMEINAEMQNRALAAESKVKTLSKICADILAAHKLSEVDWKAMRELETIL